MERLTILSVSDATYLPFIRVLFNSIKCNVKVPYKFHLHTINVPDKKLPFFKDTYKNIEFTEDKIELDETADPSNAFKKSKKASYCANIRAKVIQYLMTRGDQYILYLDADSIVRKDFNLLLDLIKQNDLIIHRRKHISYETHKVLTSVIGINNNKNSLSFLEMWKDFMLADSNLYKWFSDQLYFYETMQKKEYIKVGHLPIEYVDWKFNDSSYVWNGKSSRKKTHKIYLKEMEKYK